MSFEGLQKWKGLKIQAQNGIVAFIGDKGPQHGWPAFTVDMDVEPTTGCEIPATEDRGIMLTQLLLLWEHVRTYCVSQNWKDRSGQLISPEIATLYVCCEHLIKPARKYGDAATSSLWPRHRSNRNQSGSYRIGGASQFACF